ncbi:DUF4476 domain-containing protein [Tenacibaculum sp. 190524A02b]|uniref:DUF4476 domain-containing protein n=1 Tax=Tenacibaculum vairaonense TaxID=3137860 RepID=UPI0031FA71BB
MKLQTTLLLLLFTSFLSFGQKKSNYQSLKLELQKNNSQKEESLKRSINFFNQNTISVNDLLDLCSYFPNDRMKYRVCLNAYPTIIDKENFFEVYDLFQSFSYAIQLYHNTQATQIQSDQIINYPNHKLYDGLVHNSCKEPMSRFMFKDLVRSLHLSNNDAINLGTLKRLINGHCLSTSQIMKLTQKLDANLNRFSFLKHAFNAVFDIENYYFTEQLIQGRLYKNRLHDFISDKIAYINTNAVNDDCFVEPNEFDYIMRTIKDERFSKQKTILAKQHIEKNCFSIEQLRTIVNDFSFDGDKLKVLKYSFPYIERKDQFYKLRDLLKFTSNRKEFDKFLLSQKL